MVPELIADYACETGEGPLWHPGEGRLYWADIPTGRMFRYDPATGVHEQFYDGDVVGGFTIQDDGSLLLFMDRGAVKIWREGQLDTIFEEISDERTTRFNDVFADPEGRVFCGTMPASDRLGRLYRLDPDRSLRVVVENVGVSNGMGLTLDHKKLYYTDTRAKQIYLYDYDRDSGDISNRSVFLDLTNEQGGPDGMTVDAEGYVWSARWDGGCVVRYSPEGKEERRIELPAKKVTSLIFGGPDYTDIYITTAGGQDKSENGPGAGGLFHLNLGIKGLPEFPSRLR